MLTVIVPLEDEPLAQSEVMNAMDQVFIKVISVLGSAQLSLNPDQSLPVPAVEKHPPQHDAALPL